VVTLLAGGALFSADALTIDAATGDLVMDDVNWGVTVVAGLVVAVLAILVTAWEYNVLLKMMLRRIREGRAAEMGDMALGMQGIGAFVVALLVLGILIGIGFALLIIPGLILMTIWVYVLVLIADKRLGLGEAMSESTALAKKPGYVMTFVALLVAGIAYSVVSWILSLIPVVGWIITLFLGLYLLAYVVAMYFQARGETDLLDHALYGTPLPADAYSGAGYPAPPPAPGTAYPPAPSAPRPDRPWSHLRLLRPFRRRRRLRRRLWPRLSRRPRRSRRLLPRRRPRHRHRPTRGLRPPNLWRRRRPPRLRSSRPRPAGGRRTAGRRSPARTTRRPRPEKRPGAARGVGRGPRLRAKGAPWSPCRSCTGTTSPAAASRSARSPVSGETWAGLRAA